MPFQVRCVSDSIEPVCFTNVSEVYLDIHKIWAFVIASKFFKWLALLTCNAVDAKSRKQYHKINPNIHHFWAD
jgi:hypothetical protein